MAWTKEQQEAISKTNSNIIVSAGAGSGKTAVLSERVIEKVNNNIHVNELLILTFTKAAASEMKDRIRKKLSKDPKYINELNLLNSSYITTFDSFALSVVKKYHYLLNIPKNISITDESIIKIEQTKIMDKVFDEYYLSNNENFNNLIDKYCIKDDSSIKKLLLNVSNNIDKLINRDEYIKNIREYFFTDENINKIIKEFNDFIETKKSLIKDILNDISYYLDSEFFDKLNICVNGYINLDIDNFKLYEKIELPKMPRGTTEEAKSLKEEIKSLLEELLTYAKFGNNEEIKNDILSSKNTIFMILNIVEKYLKYLEEYKNNNEIYTFKDIASNAIKLVKEYPEVRDELKYSFKEIMIDEYQDTNDVQDTFMSYIENNNVYMVGDIKQSIYRFNGSNPSIFKDKYDNYKEGIKGYKIDLLKNFRSRSEVLNNINEIFSYIMDNNIGGAEYQESHKMVYGNTNYDNEKEESFNYDMKVLEYNKDDNFSNIEIEAFTIAKDIKDKINSNIKVFDKETNHLRKSTYNDFVIILDRSKYFDDIKKILEYNEIPCTILKEDKLNTNIDINIIKNIIDFILRINSKDYGIEFKYDFVSIARSFLFELSDEEIFDYFRNNNIKDSLVFKTFSSIDSLNSKTCNELLNEILDITDFYNKIYKIGDYEEVNVRLKNIYNIASNLNELSYSIEEFKQYLEDILENGIDIKYESFKKENDSVKIMTIHKSKGLEYPFCYFADLDHEFNTMELKDKFIVDKNYGLIIPSDLSDKNNSIQKILYTNNFYKEEISEKIRLFYVALTRARENMIIILPNKETKELKLNTNGYINDIDRLNIRKLSDIMYYVKDYLDKYYEVIDLKDINLTKDYLLIKEKEKLNTNNKDNLIVKEINITNNEIEEKHFSKETNKLINKDTLNNMKLGTKLHEIFEYIDLKNYKDKPINDEFINDKIMKFLSNDLLSNIKDSNIYHEYEFIYTKDNTKYHGIIDLMLEYKDKIDIIDFKLKNVVDENYKKQLNGYKEYIESISNKKVNLYLYSILDSKILLIY